MSEGAAYAVLRNDAPESLREFLMMPWPKLLMRSPDAPVGRIPLEILDHGDQQYLKRWYTHGGLLGPLLGGLFLGTSRPFRELDTATYAVASGVPTVDPIGACVWKIAGPIYRCALLTRRAFGATNMAEYVAKTRHMDAQTRRDLIEQTAQAVRRALERTPVQGVWYPHQADARGAHGERQPIVVILGIDVSRQADVVEVHAALRAQGQLLCLLKRRHQVKVWANEL